MRGARPRVRGKFIFVGEEKLYVRGTTYGTFRPAEDGSEYEPEIVEGDFSQMAANGFNAVRTYTVPPRWLLDAAQRYGLYVMVGLPWEQHITFLDDRRRARSIEERVRAGVRACAGHPALLCYTIGNEIPASIVRWHGRRRIERYLERLCRAAKDEDPEGLVTYVNYPSTEYLKLSFVDFFSFNVYLEEHGSLKAYLARLHNIAGERPVLMAELGLDSRRNGEEAQARALEWQLGTTFAAGCAGAFVFAWTDEWHRGGYDIEDWDFGLTDRERRPKPALAAVRRALVNAPFLKDPPSDSPWPRISVIVCTYNGERTIRDCLEGLLNLDYPNFEVVIVDDGSTDATAKIAGEYPFRLIRTENRGLGNARNTGMEAASGEIVAYLDDDAYPDPHWLLYLAYTFMSTTHAGVGGLNVAPPGDGTTAACVDNAPGNPVHILLTDQEAEHIPGCNMAFRKGCLEEIGGFDPQFRVAGDDVDVCWRRRERGSTLGFSPAAMVWHHRRDSVRAYWRQQKGYGKSEALLERKWPEKYNVAGHLLWAGRIYGKGLMRALAWPQERIHYGVWGAGLFQSIYTSSPGALWSLPLMPEWCLIIAALVLLSPLGALWEPLLLTIPLLGLAVGLSVFQAGVSAAHASFPSALQNRVARLKLLGLTALLHLLQLLARLYGRLRYGLTPWRLRSRLTNLSLPRPRTSTIWSERWQAPDEWLRSVEETLRAAGGYVYRGGDYDRWELEAWGGRLGAIRTRMAIEEHGGGRQLVRFYTWSRCPLGGVMMILLLAALSGGAAYDQAWGAAVVLGVIAASLVLLSVWECAAAIGAFLGAVEESGNMYASSGTSNRTKVHRV